MSVPSEELTTRSYEPTDEEAVLDLLRETLGETAATQRTPEFWRWKHFDNPFGTSFLRIASDQAGRIIGLRAFMQWRFRIGAHSLRAVQAVDTATHPQYRRIGVFSTLTKQVVEDARKDGVAMIFNTPNVFSRPGYQKLGWRDVGTVTPLFLILRPGRVFLRLAAGSLGVGSRVYSPRSFFRRPLPEAGTILEKGEALEALLSNHGRSYGGSSAIITAQSADYLRWRYTTHPHLTYFAKWIEGPGDLPASAVVRANTRLGLREVLLSEVLVTRPDERQCHALLEELRSVLAADYMVAYAREGSFLRGALQRHGFRSPPSPLLNAIFENRLFRFPEPQKPRRLMVRPLQLDIPFDPFRLRNWALSVGDLEIF